MYVIAGLLCSVIIVQAIIQHIERKDLYDRVQSGTYNDYKAAKESPKARPPTRHEVTLKKWREMGGGDIE